MFPRRTFSQRIYPELAVRVNVGIRKGNKWEGGVEYIKFF